MNACAMCVLTSAWTWIAIFFSFSFWKLNKNKRFILSSFFVVFYGPWWFKLHKFSQNSEINSSNYMQSNVIQPHVPFKWVMPSTVQDNTQTSGRVTIQVREESNLKQEAATGEWSSGHNRKQDRTKNSIWRYETQALYICIIHKRATN